MHSFSGIWKSTYLLVAALFLVVSPIAPAFAAADIVVSGDRADAETIKSFFAGTSQAEVDKGLEALRAEGLAADRVRHGGLASGRISPADRRGGRSPRGSESCDRTTS